MKCGFASSCKPGDAHPRSTGALSLAPVAVGATRHPHLALPRTARKMLGAPQPAGVARASRCRSASIPSPLRRRPLGHKRYVQGRIPWYPRDLDWCTLRTFRLFDGLRRDRDKDGTIATE